MKTRLFALVAAAAAVASPVAAQEARARVHSHPGLAAEVTSAMREAEAAIRDAMREVEREVRTAQRDAQTAQRQVLRSDIRARVSATAGWAAKSWAESQQSRRGPEQTEVIDRSFKVGPNGSLDLSNVSGDLVVKAGGGDTISIRAVKRARGSDWKDQFARTTVGMVERGGRVEVTTDYTGRGNHASVDYTVTAPAGTALNLKSVSGDIDLAGMQGELRAETVSGDVTAPGATGATFLKTVSGNVETGGVSTQTELRAESVSGDVTVRGAKVRSLVAETVSGAVRLDDIASDRVSGKSLSGDVVYSGTVSKGGRYNFNSHSGGIRLTVPANAGFELDARTFSGNVRSDLPLTMGGPGREAVRTSRDRGLRGVHGDGGALLSLSSFSGDIVVTRAGGSR